MCRDIRAGLPLASESIDCIAAIHVLQDMNYNDVAPALRELWRVLKPHGVLRLGLPDLDKAIRAYLDNDPEYFYVPDVDAKDIGAKLVTQIIWYGSVFTPMTFGFISEWLRAAGYHEIRRCDYRITASQFLDLADLDNRPRESMYIEATK